MLPLEELRTKYIPISSFSSLYGISENVVNEMIDSHKIHKAEFRAPGDRLRSVHVNYEEVLIALGRESEL